MWHLIGLELTCVGLLVEFANHYTTGGVLGWKYFKTHTHICINRGREIPKKREEKREREKTIKRRETHRQTIKIQKREKP